MTEPVTPGAGDIPAPARLPPAEGQEAQDQAVQDQVAEKRVSWAELFFDLVFVFAVTQVSAAMGHDHSGAGLLRALILLVPVYWLWVGTTIQVNQLNIDRAVLRIMVFAVALAAVFMALAIPGAYGDSGLLYALAYWAGRIVLGTNVVRRAVREGQRPLNPYTVSMAVTGPLLVVGALAHGGLREGLWAIAAVGDLSSPTILQARLSGIHLDAGHLAERFGGFVLIALGESVVAVGASAQSGHGLSALAGLTVAAAFALSCALWWVYFHFAADAVRHSLATAKVQLDITRLVLSYGHLSFITAIIVISVGMHQAVAHPGQRLSWAVAGLLFGGTALYLATFGFTRWAMFRLVSVTRLTAAAVIVLLWPAAPFVPALAALAALAAVVAVLNVVELLRVNQIGWRAKLRDRT
jgi:low temperature requirement protein LtrA